jgi:imidazolonepropionase-like amidohydrolase
VRDSTRPEPAPNASGPGPSRYLITAASVWDGIALEPVREGFVQVEGDRITAIGRIADLGSATAEAGPRVDLPGATLLPGLINGHVHLVLSGSRAPIRDYLKEAASGVAALTVQAVRNLRCAVEAGVTTVRDLGVPNQVGFVVREAVADGRITGPNVVTSGQPITVTGGHCHWFSHECDSVTEVRVAVRRQARDGADWIKLILSGGNLTPRTNPARPQFSEAEVRACVEESRRLGIPVAAHAYDPLSIRWAVTAGVSTVEHSVFETEDGISYDPALADLMAACNVAFVPTISGALHRMQTVAGGGAAPVAARYRERRAQIREVFRRLVAAGVPVVAGSDAGVPQREFHEFPADLAALVGPEGIGLTPREALIAATSGAASHLGIGETGVLAPGRRADLLAVDGDPLRDIRAITRPSFILAAGRPVAPASTLSAGLDARPPDRIPALSNTRRGA